MEKPTIQFRALSSKQRIDRAAGMILGVSVMTIGPALGHGMSIDKAGLEQCLAACTSHGEEGVKLVINHDSGFEEIVGAVKNFRIEGEQLLGDAYVLESAPQRDRIFELAEKLPGQFGLSVETWGDPEKIPGSNEELYRCAGISAIALVPSPAANKRGLFSKIDTQPNTMTPEEIQSAVASAVAEVVPDAVAQVVDPIKEELSQLGARFKKLEEGDKKTDAEEEQKKEEDKLAKLGSAIAAEAIKKLGVSTAPRAADPTPAGGAKLHKFQQKVEELIKQGVKNPNGAAVSRYPELYEEYRISLEKGGN